ncbi:hypothetical protein IGI04_008530, partial [Brassica rapa subsp. trilocularis]
RHCELRVWESKKSLDPCEDRVRGLKSFWVGLDVKIKRDFMKVSIAKLMKGRPGVIRYWLGCEPVDAVAAVGMIKTQLAYVKAFTSKSRKKGWSNEWPLAAVEERKLLKSVITQKVLLIDAKILLIDNSRIRLLDKLIRLSRTSTSMSSPVDKNVERTPSVNLEDTIASEKGRLEISSNADIQEEATKVNHGDSVSGNLESALGEAAARYNSALDMTALMNINVLKEDIKYNKQPFHGNLEEQVPCELQNLFSAVVSGEIKTEGVYCFILRDLLASLEEAKSLTKSRCDIKSGGCGTTNFVHHVISRCPSIFIIVLEWEKSETEKEIFETTKALEWEIDISRLYYKGLEQNTNYRLVSMVGYGEEEREHICMAYEKSRWVNLRRESLAGEVVGNNWKNVVRFCGEMKVRPEILFYEELPDP